MIMLGSCVFLLLLLFAADTIDNADKKRRNIPATATVNVLFCPIFAVS